MYNLLVANISEWNGDPFIREIDRCVNVHEYTDKKIAEKYGNLSLARIDEITQFPCIFAYETQCHKDPKFGFIRDITKGQGKVKILYEIIQLDKFLTHSDLEEMHSELDIHPWEYNRTHWSIKDVDLPKELVAKEIYLLQSSNRNSKVIDPPRHHFDASSSIPGEMRQDIEPLIAASEHEIGRDRTAVKIFFCYAREDQALLNKLKTHLRPLQRQSLIEVWDDGDISPGTEWEQKIDKQLNTAQIILLLVSPDFMDSEYCYSIEMKRAIERHERKEARVIPVILRPVYWQVDPLNKLAAMPTDGKPVMSASWHSLDEALLNVTEGIRKVVEELTHKPVSVLPLASEQAQPKVTQASTPLPIAQSVREGLSLIASMPVEKLRVLRTLTGHTGFVYSEVISADGQRLFSASGDQTIKEWDLSTGSVVRTLTGHTDAVMSEAISADGQWLFSGSQDQTIKEWDLSTGRAVRTLTGHTSGVWSVAISTDGQRLFSASMDKAIKEWDLSTGSVVRTFAGHTSGVRSVAISADGQSLFSASMDKTIKEWDLSTGSVVRTFAGHRGEVRSVAISADGQRLFSASGDQTIKEWDLSTGREVCTLTGHTSVVRSVAISADGRQLFSASMDKTIKIWGG